MLVTLATLSVTISSPVEEKVKVILATTGTMHENSFIAHSLNYWQEAPFLLRNNYLSNRIPSSETQGQIVGVRESLNRWKNMAQKKSKERPEELLGTMSYQNSSKRSPLLWLLIVDSQKPERQRPFGTGLVRHCPQGLFWPFFTFLRALFFRSCRLSLAPTICPWVSEDAIRRSKVTLLFSLTCSVDFFMLRPHNKPAFLALIPPSFTSIHIS